MNGIKEVRSGTAIYDPNRPTSNNPFTSIPADCDRNPFRLIWIDLLSVCKYMGLLPLIVWPLRSPKSTPLDELYPTASNLKDVILQSMLIISQIFLFITMPIVATLTWFLPNFVNIVYYFIFLICTTAVCRLLNGGPHTECRVGMPPEGVEPVNDKHELWFFVNGIATGKHWQQSNLDLLAQIFQREIVGIHNPTKGLLLDLIECLIQRDLNYQTSDIRQGRSQLRSALISKWTRKIVLILHSQGGIEGSSILDWLYTDLTPAELSKLEIFTFGNAARRFNNPFIIKPDFSKGNVGDRAIRHIEHYCNSEDFVANIGVRQFTTNTAKAYSEGNSFVGEVFTRRGTGHLLNMHYLNTMFEMQDGRVIENGNIFMNSSLKERTLNGSNMQRNDDQAELRIKDVSRLWAYRNGKKPVDEPKPSFELVYGKINGAQENGDGIDHARKAQVETQAPNVELFQQSF